MASTDVKFNINMENIPGKIYRNDQRVPEFDPENEYKKCEMIEKFKKDLGIESPSLLWKEFQRTIPREFGKTPGSIARQILKDVAGIDSDDIHELTNKIVFGDAKKPSPTYFFANLNNIRMRTEIEHNIENNTSTFRYKGPSGGPVIKVVVDRKNVIGGLRKTTEDYAIKEIAKRYDDMMCRRYFNMSAIDFKILSDKVVRLGGRVEIEDCLWNPSAITYDGPMVNIQLPAYKLDRLKIANELVYQHMLTPRIPAVDKIVTHNDRVTIVYFMDGTFTKCVCGKDEEFNLYTGVAFCLFKKMLSRGGDNGHKKFNSMMRKAMKTIEDEEKLQKMIKQAKHEEKLHEAKRLEKKRRKEFKKKEEQIRIMQEALRRDREAANLEIIPEAFKSDC